MKIPHSKISEIKVVFLRYLNSLCIRATSYSICDVDKQFCIHFNILRTSILRILITLNMRSVVIDALVLKDFFQKNSFLNIFNLVFDWYFIFWMY